MRRGRIAGGISSGWGDTRRVAATVAVADGLGERGASGDAVEMLPLPPNHLNYLNFDFSNYA